MFTDRRALRGINTVFTVLVVGGIVGTAVIVYRAKKATQASPLPPRIRILRELRQQAVQAEKRGALAEAESYYRASLEREPNSGNASFALATFYERTGQKDKAWRTYQSFVPALIRARQIPSGGAAILLHYGDACLSKGRTEEAKATYSMMLQADGAVRQQRSLFESNQLPNKLATCRSLAYLTCVGTNGLLPPPDETPGLKAPSGSGVERESFIRTAIAIDPKGVVPRYSLAKMFVNAGKSDEAEKLLRAAERDVAPSDYLSLWYLTNGYRHATLAKDCDRLASRTALAFDIRRSYLCLEFLRSLDTNKQTAVANLLINRIISSKNKNLSTCESYTNGMINSGHKDSARFLVLQAAQDSTKIDPENQGEVNSAITMARFAFDLGMKPEAKKLVSLAQPLIKTDMQRTWLKEAESMDRSAPAPTAAPR